MHVQGFRGSLEEHETSLHGRSFLGVASKLLINYPAWLFVFTGGGGNNNKLNGCAITTLPTRWRQSAAVFSCLQATETFLPLLIVVSMARDTFFTRGFKEACFLHQHYFLHPSDALNPPLCISASKQSLKDASDRTLPRR